MSKKYTSDDNRSMQLNSNNERHWSVRDNEYDDDFEVRRIAAMSLGEVGAYTSFSVREAVFELTENVGHQIQQLKIALEKNKMNNFHIKCRLQDSKAILKILYHYIRLYKYGFVE